MQNTLISEMKSCTKCTLSTHKKTYGAGQGRILLILPNINQDTERRGIQHSERINWFSQCWSHTVKEDRRNFFNHFYVSSALLCRTHNASHKNQDRLPSWGEIKNCRERLLWEIYELDPLIIISSGACATQALVGRSSKLPRNTGNPIDLFTINVPGECGPVFYSALGIPNIDVAIDRADYDDPNGHIAKIKKGISFTYDLYKSLQGEDYDR